MEEFDDDIFNMVLEFFLDVKKGIKNDSDGRRSEFEFEDCYPPIFDDFIEYLLERNLIEDIDESEDGGIIYEFKF